MNIFAGLIFCIILWFYVATKVPNQNYINEKTYIETIKEEPKVEETNTTKKITTSTTERIIVTAIMTSALIIFFSFGRNKS